MSNFEDYISKTIEYETGGDKSGAYTNDPDDKGGETKWGISKRANPTVDINKLTFKRAMAIYKKKYWHPLYEDITSKRIAFKVFDLGVLMGPRKPVRALQRTLKKELGFCIRPDGWYGPMTHAALESADRSQERNIYSDFVHRMGKRIGWISLKPGNKKFKIGWMKRVNYIYREV